MIYFIVGLTLLLLMIFLVFYRRRPSVVMERRIRRAYRLLQKKRKGQSGSEKLDDQYLKSLQQLSAWIRTNLSKGEVELAIYGVKEYKTLLAEYLSCLSGRETSLTGGEVQFCKKAILDTTKLCLSGIQGKQALVITNALESLKLLGHEIIKHREPELLQQLTEQFLILGLYTIEQGEFVTVSQVDKHLYELGQKVLYKGEDAGGVQFVRVLTLHARTLLQRKEIASAQEVTNQLAGLTEITVKKELFGNKLGYEFAMGFTALGIMAIKLEELYITKVSIRMLANLGYISISTYDFLALSITEYLEDLGGMSIIEGKLAVCQMISAQLTRMAAKAIREHAVNLALACSNALLNFSKLAIERNDLLNTYQIAFYLQEIGRALLKKELEFKHQPLATPEFDLISTKENLDERRWALKSIFDGFLVLGKMAYRKGIVDQPEKFITSAQAMWRSQFTEQPRKQSIVDKFCQLWLAYLFMTRQRQESLQIDTELLERFYAKLSEMDKLTSILNSETQINLNQLLSEIK